MNSAPVAVVKNLNIVMVVNRIKYLILMFATAWSFSGSAQNTLKEGPEISRMLSAYSAKNKQQETVKAWRIQVAAGSDRRVIENEQRRFENIYPSLELELLHDNPYYILKIQDRAYRSKVDALALLHRIKSRYPSAILVLDDVRTEKLLNSQSY